MDKAGRKPTKNDTARRKRRQHRKSKLIALKGGRCERCLKSFHPSVYEFHHRNPDQKEVGLNKGVIGDRNWAWVLQEAEKCNLLCANCHREVHAFDDHRFLEFPPEEVKKDQRK